MPNPSGDTEREPSSQATQAAEERGLGTPVDTLPLQKRGLFKFKDTGHLVHCFEAGFVDAPTGGAPVAMQYDQIAWVKQAFIQQYINHFYRQTSFWFTISSVDQKVIRWQGGYAEQGPQHGCDPRLPRLAIRLAEKVSATRLPAHRKALADGKHLPFGNIIISQQGVYGQDGLVPWSEVNPLAVDHGVAIVKRFGHRQTVAGTHLGSIPNLPMFLTLYEELRRGRRK